jgi:hypothetical protein
VNRASLAPWTALVLLFLGLFGIALAATGLWAALPPPAVGGTCGPGRGSETAIEALVDPASIGAGPEPAAIGGVARAQWSQFVNECQTATNDRALATLPVLVVSIGMAVTGFLALRRRSGRPAVPTPAPAPAEPPWWSLPHDTLMSTSPPLPTAPAAAPDGTGGDTGSLPPPPRGDRELDGS